MLWYWLVFYSLVINKKQSTGVIKTKEFVFIALWTTLVMFFLRKFCYDSKGTIKWPERLLFTLLTSTQAIQTKTKTVSDLWRYQLINRSNYELKNSSLIWKFKVSTMVSIRQSHRKWHRWNLPKCIITPYQVWSHWGKYQMMNNFFKFGPPQKNQFCPYSNYKATRFCSINAWFVKWLWIASQQSY